MRTYTSTITATGWQPVGAWNDGSGSTTKSVRIRRWTMRRRRAGIVRRGSLAASRRAGNRCGLLLKARLYRRADPNRELRSVRWMNSETELENRPPAAVEKGTQEKRKGRAALVYATSFSLSKMNEAQRDREPKETGAASRNASLKNAPSGSNIGVHLNQFGSTFCS